MKKAQFIGSGHLNNGIFDLATENNPDNWHYPYWLLREKFSQKGIELNTQDVAVAGEIGFELHMNVQKELRSGIPKYVLLCESAYICPMNQSQSQLAKYRIVFTWRDDLVDGQKFIKINLPNKIVVNSSRGWYGRDKLCCLISANKAVNQPTPLELYSERVNTIRWFEQNAPQDFDLFGGGWDAPAARPGLANRIARKLSQYLPKDSSKVYFPSYRGRVESKHETMQMYRFNICYENVRDLTGYITEKIWDSFFAACVPVYWGPSNITDCIPEDCFIDRRKFFNHEDLYKFMVSISEVEYIAYQTRIAAFLASEKARLFSAETFAKTIANTIASDLGITV